MKNLAVKRPRIIGIALLVLLALLVVAWIDGGYEPIRPITEPLDMPENAQ